MLKFKQHTDLQSTVCKKLTCFGFVQVYKAVQGLQLDHMPGLIHMNYLPAEIFPCCSCPSSLSGTAWPEAPVLARQLPDFDQPKPIVVAVRLTDEEVRQQLVRVGQLLALHLEALSKNPAGHSSFSEDRYHTMMTSVASRTAETKGTGVQRGISATARADDDLLMASDRERSTDAFKGQCQLPLR